MSLPPHWLDGVFEDGKGDVDATTKSLLKHEQFKAAIAAGTSKYLEAQLNSKELPPNWTGPTPEQYARSAFLDGAALKPKSPGESND